jgi:hypothetical protein
MDEKPKNLAGEELRQPGVVDPGDLVEDAGLVHSALSHQEMEVGMEIYPGPECLDGGDHSGHNVSACHKFEITDEGAESAEAKLPQQLPVVLEEYPEHPGDGEDDLAVGDIEEQSFPHLLAPFLQPLGMAGGAKPAGTAGEHQEVFRVAVGTADAGEPAARVAAIEVSFNDFLDDGPKEAVWLLEAALILGQEPVEVMKQHLVENSALRMPRTIHSRHSGRMDSKNGPSSWIRPLLPENRGGAPAGQFESGR